MKRWEQEQAGYPSKVSRKLDGVYARATKDGVRTKSGKRLDVPRVEKRLRRHFRKNPDGALEGELYRKGAGLEKIAGEARSGGKAARKLKLHVHPGQGKTPLPIGAVRRVGEKTARDGRKVQKLLGKEVKRGGEGVVVRGPDGVRRKLKPRHDEEHEVVGASSGKRGVVTLKGGQKVQGRTGVSAKIGDRVTVSHEGKTRRGKMRSAVAERVRNDQDFAMRYDTPAQRILGSEHPYVRVQEFRVNDDEEVRKDRKALGRLAAKAAVGATVAGVLLHKGRGAKTVRTILPKKVKAAAVKKPKKTPIGSRSSRRKLAWANAERKGGAVERQVKAEKLRKKRGWGAVEKPFRPGVAKATPEVRAKADKLLKDGRSYSPKMPTDKAGSAALSPREHGKLTRESRRAAREQLGALRDKHRFAMKDDNKRDNLSKARDIAIVGAGAGVTAAGVAGVKTAQATTKAVKDVQYRVGKAARTAKRTVTPESVAKAGGKLAKEKVKKVAKRYFPTFTKAGKAVAKGLRKTVFETPAGRIVPGLMEFVSAREQLRNEESDAFASPLKVAAGVERAYRVNKNGDRVLENLPVGNAQVVRAAYRKAGQVNKWGKRGGSLAKDAKNVVQGNPRERDAAGRKKKREWEKEWFKDAQRKAVIGGGILAYAGGMRKSPKFRAANIRVAKKVRNKVNEYVPDAFPGRDFETPAQRIIEMAQLPVRGRAAVTAIGRNVIRVRDGKTPVQVTKQGRRILRKSFKKAGINEKELTRTRKRRAVGGVAADYYKGRKLPPPDLDLNFETPAQRMGLIELESGEAVKKRLKTVAGEDAYWDALDRQRKKKTPKKLKKIELDSQAAGAGWDVRDARGRSARVFAPGSKGRVRREKLWHEKAENERKLWKGGVAAAAVGGIVAGVAGKRAVKKGSAVLKVVKRITAGGGFGRGKVKPAVAVAPAKMRRPRRKGLHPEVASRVAAQRKKKVIEFPSAS